MLFSLVPTLNFIIREATKQANNAYRARLQLISMKYTKFSTLEITAIHKYIILYMIVFLFLSYSTLLQGNPLPTQRESFNLLQHGNLLLGGTVVTFLDLELRRNIVRQIHWL